MSSNLNGFGSLREAIAAANADSGSPVIEFTVNNTISDLPALTKGVVIDATIAPTHASGGASAKQRIPAWTGYGRGGGRTADSEAGTNGSREISRNESPRWLIWVRELQAIAQTGLTYAQDQFDRDRYQRLSALAAEIMAEHTGMDAQSIAEMFAQQAGYATPKLGVRGAVFRDGRLLLVRETADAGRWTLPGGWADVNESPAEAVAREVREEAGVEVRPYKLVTVWDRARHPHGDLSPFHVWRLFFLCEIIGGEPQCGPETSEVGFFAEHELPTELSTGRVLLPQLRRMFDHLRQPDLPTEFD